MFENPLVSVVMPAYKLDYILETLDSLFVQTYKNIELIICDDSGDDSLRKHIEGKISLAKFPVYYSKNEKRLWGFGGVEKGVGVSRGEYIKILHDDDLLKPDSIEELLRTLQKFVNVTLVTSKRERIDENGRLLRENIYTANPFLSDVIIKGEDVITFLADHTINFIGEPSCIMFRKKDLVFFKDRYSFLNGKAINWVGDLAFYVKFLSFGDLAYLSKPLAQFRVSKQQFSQIGRDRVGIGEKGHADFRQAIHELGWYKNSRESSLVKVARIGLEGNILPFRNLNLLDMLKKAAQTTLLEEVSIERWLNERHLSPILKEKMKVFSENSFMPSIAVVVFNSFDQSFYKNLENKVSLEGFILPKVKFYYEEFLDLNKVNCLLKEIEQDWVLFINYGDELLDSGLLMAKIELAKRPNLAAISFDSIYRQTDGSLGLAVRPSLFLDYLISFPAGMSKHWMYNRNYLLQMGGLSNELPQAYELDALLRIINNEGLGGVGHIPEPLVISTAPVLINVDDERKAIIKHLSVRGYNDAKLHAPNPGRYQVVYGDFGNPKVSIVIYSGNDLLSLQKCIESIFSHTNYTNFEILCLQQPDSCIEIKNWLDAISKISEEKIRVIAVKQISLSQQFNSAVGYAKGDYLLFLSPYIVVFAGNWLEEMLNHAQRAEVGIVGSKLLNVDGRVAHAGYILGLTGIVGSPFLNAKHDAPGYMQRLQVDQNLSAVGLDCLMISSGLFSSVNGFTIDLAESYISTDLCLRVGQFGYLVVWTPHALLVLNKQETQEVDINKQDLMYERWLPQLARDPAYSPNMSLALPGGYKLADSKLSWRPLESFKSIPVALVHPADLYGSGHYRVIQPFLAMQKAGLVDGAISTKLLQVTDFERYNPDFVILQRQVGEERLRAMQRMKRFSNAFKVYELDDYLQNLPMKNIHRNSMPKDIIKSLRRGLSYVDRFVVTTNALADAFSNQHSEIVVCKNLLPLTWWQGLISQRLQSDKPRVGWAGGISHEGDLEMIADVVRDLADEVHWVFLGMCPDKLRPYVHEYHEGVSIEEYPSKLASLNLDIAIAPLEDNFFNQCKSNLKQLEYGACGVPVICSDIRPYREGQQAGLPVTLVKNRYKDWMDAIRSHVNDLEVSFKIGDELQAKVHTDWMLEGPQLLKWRDAWVGS